MTTSRRKHRRGRAEAAAHGTAAHLAAPHFHALRDSEQRFRALAENATDGIITIDLDDRIHFANAAVERIFGYSADELARLSFPSLMPERHRAAHRAGMHRYATTGTRHIRWDGIELNGLHKDGHEIPLEITFGEYVQNGRRYFTGIMRDITERKRVEEQMRLLAESRSLLMRGFSHDVKNPLGAADGYAQLLEAGILDDLTGRQREGIGHIRRGLRAALRLIDDLLHLARAEAGDIELTLAPMDVRDAVHEIAAGYRAQAEGKGLQMETVVPDELPLIDSDRARVTQILGNLMSNAIKYTDTGRIAVQVELREGHSTPGPGQWIATDVSDTGSGITPDDQRQLFKEFVRLRRGREEGAGIGLAISRRMAAALDGEITVSSELGKGSVFTLWLPLDAEPASSP